jgi:hypothetical protein
MAWTAPATWVANQTLTAAMLNAQLRDNFLELDVAKALTEGSIIGTAGLNSLAEKVPAFTTFLTTDVVANLTYVPLTSLSVTLTTGTVALVLNACKMQNNTANQSTWCSWAVSGATTVAAADSKALVLNGMAANFPSQFSDFYLITGLTPGSNTFTQQFHVDGGTATVGPRQLVVWPQ